MLTPTSMAIFFLSQKSGTRRNSRSKWFGRKCNSRSIQSRGIFSASFFDNLNFSASKFIADQPFVFSHAQLVDLGCYGKIVVVGKIASSLASATFLREISPPLIYRKSFRGDTKANRARTVIQRVISSDPASTLADSRRPSNAQNTRSAPQKAKAEFCEIL